MEDLNFRKGDAKTDVFGSDRMLQPSPVERIPDGPTTPEVAYQMVKDETFTIHYGDTRIFGFINIVDVDCLIHQLGSVIVHIGGYESS